MLSRPKLMLVNNIHILHFKHFKVVTVLLAVGKNQYAFSFIPSEEAVVAFLFVS